MKPDQIRERAAAAGARLRDSVVVAVLTGLGRANVTDRAMTLAGQAFTSILPVLILITSMPGRGPIERALDRISSQWLELDTGSSFTSDATVASFGIAGVLMTVIGATSFSRALDRMYAEVWEYPRLGIAGWWRWPLIIAAIVAGITVEVFLIRSWPYGLTMVIETALSLLLWALVWAAVTRLLTAGRVGGRDVLATGVAIGSAVALFFLLTQIGFVPILTNAEARFGTLGVVFSVIGWLFVYAWVMVAAVVVVHTVRTWTPRVSAS
ncbi:hypothetical protein [Gordonia caeni]|uniref:Uncharacterized protein n=1 Tax=Gordonia caeni TaxID=1007097 RepID=A0ABP7PKC7_9ACTN